MYKSQMMAENYLLMLKWVINNSQWLRPNKEYDRLRSLNSLKKFISTFSEQGSKIIIGSDFNCNANIQNDKSFKILCKLFKEQDLIDVWHYKNPNYVGFTWCDAQNCPKSRIDYIFVKKKWLYRLC